MSSFSASGKRSINQAQPSLKLPHLFEGLTVSRNFKLLLLVACLIFWLYVIYWVRHHEPLLHEVMGNGVLHSTTSDADRQIVNHVNSAFPIKTSPQMGILYQPDISVADNNNTPVSTPPPSNQAANAAANQVVAYPSIGAGQAMSAPSFVEAKFGLPRGYVLKDSTGTNYNAAEPILANPSLQSLPFLPAAASYSTPTSTLSHYYVPIHSPNGTYLKTVANR